MKDCNIYKFFSLAIVITFSLFLNVVTAHSSLMVDLERQYEARAHWAEYTEPELSLVIMMESQSFEEDSVLKEAVKFLKTFESHYERVSLIFSDKQSVGFLPAKRYGVVLTDGKVEVLPLMGLKADVKLVMAAGKARASMQSNHGHDN